MARTDQKRQEGIGVALTVGVLIEGLGREDGLEETREALRGLIEKIVLVPRPE